MKRLLPFVLTAFIFVFSVSSVAYNGYTYVNMIADDADLFSEYEESEIQTAIDDFSEEKNYSLIVVTTEFTSGVSSEEYADDYYDYLIDNEGLQENGLLFLIDMDNRNVWISTCGECQLAYNDSEIDTIIDSGYDSLVNGDYAQCILEMTEEARNTDTVIDENEDYYITDDSMFGDSFFSGSTVEINGKKYIVSDDGEWIPVEDDNNINDYYYDDYEYTVTTKKSFSLSDALIYIIVGLAAGGIAVFFVKNRYKNLGKGDEFNSDDVVLNVTASNDTIISRNVVTTRIPRNNNNHHGGSRGGGFSGGGGSSVHRSGGGRSHGGGGRGF